MQEINVATAELLCSQASAEDGGERGGGGGDGQGQVLRTGLLRPVRQGILRSGW